jgi:hypothetical protein
MIQWWWWWGWWWRVVVTMMIIDDGHAIAIIVAFRHTSVPCVS